MRAILFLMIALLAGCSHLSRDQGDTMKTVTFSPPDWPQTLSADIYMPDQHGPHDVVLLVHGGGWASRSRHDMDNIAVRLQREGWLVMNIDYRFAPEYIFPSQLHDVQLAMHWLHDAADDLNINTDRIHAFGYSSGAHLVVLMGLVAGQGGELDTPHGGPLTRPHSIVAGGTPTDLRKYSGGRLVTQFVGGDQRTAAAAYAQASPITHVHGDAPPIFLFHANRDITVPLDHATDLTAALQQQGACVHLHRQSFRGHISGFLFRGAAMNDAVAFMRQANC